MAEQDGFYIYSPKVEVYVLGEGGKVYDLSPDVVSVSMELKTDAPSSSSITLAARDDKYDGAFQPMDRVVIFAKKDSKYQMFSGYLTDVPLYTIGNVTLQALCSLHKLQCLFWDEGLSESIHLYNYFVTEEAGGMGDLLNSIINILVEVAEWDPNKIHIAPIPTEIIEYAASMKERLAPDERAIEDYNRLIGGSFLDGVSSSGGGGVTGEQLKAAWIAGPTGSADDAEGKDWGAWAASINSVSGEYSVPAWMLAAICEAESNWRPKATNRNSNGSADYGLCQINNSWSGNDIVKVGRGNEDYFSNNNWQDPLHSMTVGARIFSRAMKSATKAYPSVERNSIEHARYSYAGYNSGSPKKYHSSAQVKSNADKFVGIASRYRSKMGSDSSVESAAASKNILQIAYNEVGYTERGNNETKYGNVPGDPWCATFVSWCAREAGVGKDVIINHARSAAHARHLSNKSRLFRGYRSRGSQMETPKPGDLFFMTNSRGIERDSSELGRINHIGFVNRVIDESTVETIEGNHGNRVALNKRKYGGTEAEANAGNCIYRFGRPAYSGSVEFVSSATGGHSDGTYDPDSVESLFAENAVAAVWWIASSVNEIGRYSYLYTGARALINDVAVWAKIKTLFGASMRSFASAPDGSIVAWFPDRFGLFTDDINYVIPNTEVTNVSVSQSAGGLATHAYLSGGWGGNPVESEIHAAVATIDNESFADGGGSNNEVSELLSKIIVMPKDAKRAKALYSPNAIYRRYGARPLVLSPIAALNNATAMPYFFALRALIDSWTTQYRVSVSTTFMPEIRPGMRVHFSDEDITAYVESVTHNMDYKSGFTTRMSLSSPTSSSRDGFMRTGWVSEDDE